MRYLQLTVSPLSFQYVTHIGNINVDFVGERNKLHRVIKFVANNIKVVSKVIKKIHTEFFHPRMLLQISQTN